jgi:hypothetical protein
MKSLSELPSWVRWAAGTIAVLVILVLAIRVLPPLLAQTDDPLGDADRLRAESNVRETLVKVLAGLVLLGGLVYTAKTFRMTAATLAINSETLNINAETLRLSAETLDLSRQAKLNERFSEAVEQLGHGSRDVHIGAIQALAGIAREEASYTVPITEILTAFVREHARPPKVPPDAHACESGNCKVRPRTDVQAAVTVLGRRFQVEPLEAVHEPADDPGSSRPAPEVVLDLTGVNLHGVEIHDLDLRLAELRWADLQCARAWRAELHHANLRDATLRHADLGEAYLVGADLGAADFTDAKLAGTHLDHSVVVGAHLQAREYGGLTVSCTMYDDRTEWPGPPKHIWFEPDEKGAVKKGSQRAPACEHERYALRRRLTVSG